MRQLISRLLAPRDKKQLSMPARPPTLYLSEDVASSTANLVASYGGPKTSHEGIVYWAGVSAPGILVVTTVIAPEATTTKGSYETSVAANADVVATVNRLKLQLLAQIHGHPHVEVGHSAGDDRGAFMPYTGFYSLVVPHYGQQGLLPLHKCGVHRYQDDRFVRLTPSEIERQFVIVPISINLRY